MVQRNAGFEVNEVHCKLSLKHIYLPNIANIIQYCRWNMKSFMSASTFGTSHVSNGATSVLIAFLDTTLLNLDFLSELTDRELTNNILKFYDQISIIQTCLLFIISKIIVHTV